LRALSSGNPLVDDIVTRLGTPHDVICELAREKRADLVVVGIGVTPDVAWLRGTGLDTALGVPVDAYARTAHPDVFAAGDVACAPHPVTGALVRVEGYANAAAHGAAAGRALAGVPVPFAPTAGAGSVQHGRRLHVVGHVLGDEEIVVRPHGHGRFVAFYLREGRVTAAFALDRARDVPAARALVAAGARVPVTILSDPDTPLPAPDP
ncbi:MAG: oxidoreductase C-terminal domain-containing protein, partial [Myxococcota bacterium]